MVTSYPAPALSQDDIGSSQLKVLLIDSGRNVPHNLSHLLVVEPQVGTGRPILALETSDVTVGLGGDQRRRRINVEVRDVVDSQILVCKATLFLCNDGLYVLIAVFGRLPAAVPELFGHTVGVGLGYSRWRLRVG